jgi:hypothetical protein
VPQQGVDVERVGCSQVPDVDARTPRRLHGQTALTSSDIIATA